MYTGAGIHWFVVHRVSEDLVEIFDPLGCNEDFFKYIQLSAFYEFNVTAVQCSDSQLCGSFVVYFIILRFLNLDMDLEDFLNDYFILDCAENEKTVKIFLEQLQP